MVKKSRRYANSRYPVCTVRQALDLFLTDVDGPFLITYSVTGPEGATSWGRGGSDNFFLAYPNSSEAHIYTDPMPDYEFGFDVNALWTEVAVHGPTEEFVNSILCIFEENRVAAASPPELIIFIGHGRHSDWKDLRDHLRDMQNLDLVYYESDPHAGQVVPSTILEMAKRSTFAILVFTKEDAQADGTFRTRQNVVHELGLLTAELGLEKSIILIEEGVDLPSNISGVDCLHFTSGHIAMTFGPLMATLKREFFAVGLPQGKNAIASSERR